MLRQVQADQVPRMRRLMAAMQQYDRWRTRLPPLQEMESQLPQHDIARHVPDAGRMRNAEIGGARQQRTELLRLGHIEWFGRIGKSVQIHDGSRVAAATF